MRNFRCPALFCLVVLLAGCRGAEPTASGSRNPSPAVADPGRRAFAGACGVCHSTGDPAAPGYTQLIGPSLYGVFGAPSGRVANYDYSKAMREADLVWNDETLNAFLENPQRVVPKTRMSFAGEPNAERRAAIIGYLKTLK